MSLFFVLSGFILAYTYILPDEGMNARKFWTARFARIYPVFFLAFLLFLPLLLLSPEGSSLKATITATIATPLLLQAWHPAVMSIINGPGWSLSAEAFFYALFPYLGAWFARRCQRRPLIAVAFVWAIAFIPPVVYLVIRPDGAATDLSAPRGLWLGVIRFSPVTRLPEFLMGIALALQFAKKRSFHRAGLVAGAAVVLIVAVTASPWFPSSILVIGGLSPLFAALILSLAYESPMAKILSAPPLVLLGEASYGLYILHMPVILWIGLLVRRFFHPYENALVLPLTQFAAAIAISIISYKFVEVPARRYILMRFRSEKTEVKPAMVAAAPRYD